MGNSLSSAHLRYGEAELDEYGRVCRALTKEEELCPFCQLFFSIAFRRKDHELFDLNLFHTLLIESNIGVDCDIIVGQKSYVSEFSKDRQLRGGELRPWNFISVNKVKLNSSCSSSLVSPSRIPYDKIISWVRSCSSAHGKSCGLERKPTTQLCVIDCANLTVVPLPPERKYVALSYVCGPLVDSSTAAPSNSEERGIRKLDPTELPLTIKDAIQVVKQLGEQYLWVDRYCIAQDNTEQKRIAILNMNEVYAGAEVTIIALDGDDISAGLPGVSSRLRSGGTRQFTLSGPRMVGTLPQFTDVVLQSTWSGRGWCYQEARLSRRCLFFTKYQLYFSCQRETISEALPQEDRQRSDSRQEQQGGLTPRSFISESAYDVEGLFLDRLVYTQKSFTVPGDALNAFRGLLGQHSYTTFWGVPVTRHGLRLDPNVQFAMGLAGSRASLIRGSKIPSVRRPGFPTWSWASVTGAIAQIDPNTGSERSHYREFLFERTSATMDPINILRPSFQVEIPNAYGALSLTDHLQITEGNVLPETSHLLIIEGDIVTLRHASPPRSHLISYHSRDGRSRCRDGREDVYNQIELPANFDTDAAKKDTLDPNQSKLQDALVLLEWCDNAPGRIQFVLMLIRWVSKVLAERVGIATIYYTFPTPESTGSLIRRRKMFKLR